MNEDSKTATPAKLSPPSSLGSGETPMTSEVQAPPPKDFRFWALFASLLLATLLAALDLSALATALPTIAEDLRTQEFTWIGTSYSIASCAFVPLSGGLAQIFGRRPVLLGSLVFFFIGSAMCGASREIDLMLAGRTFQGIGAGGILTLSEIILADIVPLAERGLYQGAFGAIWALASATGPIIGGALAATNWRWLFYLNLPLTAIVAVIATLYVKLPTPPGTLREKSKQLNILGNVVFIIAITLFTTGLTYGGNTYPWTDVHVLAPLIIGVIGLFAWVGLERYYVKYPTVPFEILFGNRTSAIGFLTTFIHGVSALALFYYWPVYFQAALGETALESAVSFFTVAFIVAPFAMVAGGTVTALKMYKPQNVIAWVFMSFGPGILYLVRANSSRAAYLALPVPFSIGIGLLFAASTFPVLAPLPPALSGQALSFLVFVRNFGSIIGITIGSVVLTNELSARLPTEYIASVPGGVAGVYSQIPNIPNLPVELSAAVENAFAEAVRVIWIVLVPFGVIGLVASLFIKEIEMETVTDAQWGLQHHKDKLIAERSEKV